MDSKEIAKEVRASAAHYRKVYRKFPGVKEDAAGLRKVASLIRLGKYKDARAEAWRLDTIVRDYIPDRAWRLIEG